MIMIIVEVEFQQKIPSLVQKHLILKNNLKLRQSDKDCSRIIRHISQEVTQEVSENYQNMPCFLENL